MGLDAQDVAVESERSIQVGDSDSDMSNAGAIRHQDLRELRVGPQRVAGPPTQQENNNMDATNTPDATHTPPVHVSDSSFALEIEQANGLVLVDFWASWCGPCHMVAPILDQLAGEYAGKAKVAKVDVDANQRTAMRFNVRSIPSILFFKNGQHVDTVIGAVPKATLEGKIKQHLL
jgi:thioredoxin 1